MSPLPPGPRQIGVEFGTGNDWHGGDYTKAALRAVQDAIHHSSLSLVGSLGLDAATMQVLVTIGVARPERVDRARIAASLPHGQVTVEVVEGGLDVPAPERADPSVIASAAITVSIVLAKD